MSSVSSMLDQVLTVALLATEECRIRHLTIPNSPSAISRLRVLNGSSTDVELCSSRSNSHEDSMHLTMMSNRQRMELCMLANMHYLMKTRNKKTAKRKMTITATMSRRVHPGTDIVG